MQINNNFASNKYNYQLQSAEKMIAEAREKRDQAAAMQAQADKLQDQAKGQERTGISIKAMVKTGVSSTNVMNQAHALETMNHVKLMMQSQPQKAIKSQSNQVNERVLHLLK